VEILLRLSEAGHYQQVSELFKFPVQNCPDMLVLALLQITVSTELSRHAGASPATDHGESLCAELADFQP
jgi:hypothetical protein